MSIKIGGADITNLYVGSEKVSRVMLNGEQVWPESAGPVLNGTIIDCENGIRIVTHPYELLYGQEQTTSSYLNGVWQMSLTWSNPMQATLTMSYQDIAAGTGEQYMTVTVYSADLKPTGYGVITEHFTAVTMSNGDKIGYAAYDDGTIYNMQGSNW